MCIRDRHRGLSLFQDRDIIFTPSAHKICSMEVLRSKDVYKRQGLRFAVDLICLMLAEFMLDKFSKIHYNKTVEGE